MLLASGLFGGLIATAVGGKDSSAANVEAAALLSVDGYWVEIAPGVFNAAYYLYVDRKASVVKKRYFKIPTGHPRPPASVVQGGPVWYDWWHNASNAVAEYEDITLKFGGYTVDGMKLHSDEFAPATAGNTFGDSGFMPQNLHVSLTRGVMLHDDCSLFKRFTPQQWAAAKPGYQTSVDLQTARSNIQTYHGYRGARLHAMEWLEEPNPFQQNKLRYETTGAPFTFCFDWQTRTPVKNFQVWNMFRQSTGALGTFGTSILEDTSNVVEAMKADTAAWSG
jgi:hypothetical protein